MNNENKVIVINEDVLNKFNGNVAEFVLELAKELTKKVRETEKKNQKPTLNVKNTIECIADDLCMSVNDTLIFLHNMLYHPGAFNSFVLRTIAKEIDSCYDTNIKDCTEVYVFDSVAGKIVKMNSPHNKNSFKYFAAFRTMDEVKFALNVLYDVRKVVVDYVCQQKD